MIESKTRTPPPTGKPTTKTVKTVQVATVRGTVKPAKPVAVKKVARPVKSAQVAREVAAEPVTRFRLDPDNPPALSHAEAARLDALPIDYSDIPELPEGFFSAERKEPVTMRLDADVLAFFKSLGGRGYQTRINAVLRAFVDRHRKVTPDTAGRRDRG